MNIRHTHTTSFNVAVFSLSAYQLTSRKRSSNSLIWDGSYEYATSSRATLTAGRQPKRKKKITRHDKTRQDMKRALYV